MTDPVETSKASSCTYLETFYLDKTQASFFTAGKNITNIFGWWLLLISIAGLIVFAIVPVGQVQIPVLSLELNRSVAGIVLCILASCMTFRYCVLFVYHERLWLKIQELAGKQDESSPPWFLAYPSFDTISNLPVDLTFSIRVIMSRVRWFVRLAMFFLPILFLLFLKDPAYVLERNVAIVVCVILLLSSAWVLIGRKKQPTSNK